MIGLNHLICKIRKIILLQYGLDIFTDNEKRIVKEMINYEAFTIIKALSAEIPTALPTQQPKTHRLGLDT
jgi:hypothetical protein